jgi:hypothetical protein
MLKTILQVPGNELEGDQMAGEPATTPRKSKPKGGRPTREQASQRALLGIDLTTCDPVAILREIALDRSMPGSTRVAACKALLGLQDQDPEHAGADTRINARAAALMQRAN